MGFIIYTTYYKINLTALAFQGNKIFKPAEEIQEDKIKRLDHGARL